MTNVFTPTFFRFINFLTTFKGPYPTQSTQAGSVDNFQWAYSVMDSSRVSTFFISILLIVYGSFRSLALEEDREGTKIENTTCLSEKYFKVVSNSFNTNCNLH